MVEEDLHGWREVRGPRGDPRWEGSGSRQSPRGRQPARTEGRGEEEELGRRNCAAPLSSLWGGLLPSDTTLRDSLLTQVTGVSRRVFFSLFN